MLGEDLEENFLCGDAAKVSWIFITKVFALCVPEVLPHPHVPKESDTTMTYVSQRPQERL